MRLCSLCKQPVRLKSGVHKACANKNGELRDDGGKLICKAVSHFRLNINRRHSEQLFADLDVSSQRMWEQGPLFEIHRCVFITDFQFSRPRWIAYPVGKLREPDTRRSR